FSVFVGLLFFVSFRSGLLAFVFPSFLPSPFPLFLPPPLGSSAPTSTCRTSSTSPRNTGSAAALRSRRLEPQHLLQLHRRQPQPGEVRRALLLLHQGPGRGRDQHAVWLRRAS
ncbi:unnamed protein product, partial [Tetraodon nigroviridis]